MSTDPIGTAQERLTRLRDSLSVNRHYMTGQTCFEVQSDLTTVLDALQSRIAKVGRLETALREIADLSLEEDLPLTDAGRCAVEIARAALSLQRRPT